MVLQVRSPPSNVEARCSLCSSTTPCPPRCLTSFIWSLQFERRFCKIKPGSCNISKWSGEIAGPWGSTLVHRLYHSFVDWGWKTGLEGAFANLVGPKLPSCRYSLQGKQHHEQGTTPVASAEAPSTKTAWEKHLWKLAVTKWGWRGQKFPGVLRMRKCNNDRGVVLHFFMLQSPIYSHQDAVVSKVSGLISAESYPAEQTRMPLQK